VLQEEKMDDGDFDASEEDSTDDENTIQELVQLNVSTAFLLMGRAWNHSY
jgi:hypothetical protein